MPSVVLPGRFRAAVFDMDGLLLDSEPLWHDTFRELLARHGDAFTDADRAATLGRALADSAGILAPRLGMPAEVLAAEIHASMLEHYTRGAPLHAGARSLIEALDGRIPLAVATNTPADVARLALRASGLDTIRVVASGTDLGRPKPLPHVYREACRLTGVAPSEAIAFEDSRNGVRSAFDAGLTVVGVPEQGVDLTGSGAHALLDSLGEVVVEP